MDFGQSWWHCACQWKTGWYDADFADDDLDTDADDAFVDATGAAFVDADADADASGGLPLSG